MDSEQTRLQASHNGFKEQITRLFNKINELVREEFDDYTTASINNAIEQLTKKMKIMKIDEHLLELAKDTTEVKSAVVEAEELMMKYQIRLPELQGSLSWKVVQNNQAEIHHQLVNKSHQYHSFQWNHNRTVITCIVVNMWMNLQA